ncbi:MAG: hypothetical protein QMD12_00685 [Candidatus Aenigmarchaeota archaeon]|nr:hypothetical protein [Candidatus Aenigmarchaeota archaeon]
MEDMEKGVSPLVAAVLLIAATMAIATVLTYWASTFVKVSLPPTENVTTECLFADFDIYSCSKVNSTDHANISLILYNRYNAELRNLTLFAFRGVNVSSYPLPDNLPGNTYKGYTVTNATWPYDKIAITTHCPTVTKESACQ